MLVTMTVSQVGDVFCEPDPSLKIYNSCDSKIKQALTLSNLIFTLFFSLCITGLSFCIKSSDGICAGYTSEKIGSIVMLTVIIYLSLMFDSVGRFVLEILFEQFAVEMIN
jgi:hypothetical protein